MVNCRTCLSFIEFDTGISVNEYTENLSSDHIQITQVIEQCISEMDLDVSDDVVICTACYNALICTYTFKLKCIQTELMIYSYMEQNNLRLGDKIELSKVVESSNSGVEDMVIASDFKSEQVTNLNENENVDVVEVVPDKLINNASDIAEKEQQNTESSATSPVCQRERYSCTKCPYKTYSKDSLEQHAQCSCESKVYKFKCPICPYESVQRSCLSRHMVIHGAERPYHCGHCDKIFWHKGGLRLHILYKHSGKRSVANLPYQCGIQNCKNTFQKKFDFNNHIVKHVDYRPFLCQLCNKGFFKESQWDKHLENVHGLCL